MAEVNTDIVIRYTLQGVEQVSAFHQKLNEQSQKFAQTQVTDNQKVTASHAAESKKRVQISEKEVAGKIVHLKRFADFEKEYQGKSDEVLTAAVAKHMRLISDEKSHRIEASIAGNREVAKASQQRIQIYQNEQNKLRALLAERPGVINRGAGASVGQLGLFRNMLLGSLGGGMIPNFIGGGGPAMLQPLTSGLSAIGPAGAIAAAGISTFGAAAAFAIKEGGSMETKLAELQAQSGMTAGALDELRKKAEAQAVKFHVDATDAVDSYRVTINALGLDLVKNTPLLDKMTESVMTLAKASGLTAEEAGGAMGTAFNMFGGKTSDPDAAAKFANIMNVLAAGARQARTQIPDLVGELAKFGPVAHQAGLSIEESVASMEALGHAGIDVGMTGKQFQAYIMELSSGSSAGTKALKQLGLTYYDINPTVVGLSNSIHTLKQKLDAVYDPVTKTGDAVKRAGIEHEIFQRRSSALAEAMMQNVDTFDTYTKAVTGTKTAYEMAADRESTFNDQMTGLWEQIKNIGIDAFFKYQTQIDKIPGALDTIIPHIVTAVSDMEKVAAAVYHVQEAIQSLKLAMPDDSTPLGKAEAKLSKEEWHKLVTTKLTIKPGQSNDDAMLEAANNLIAQDAWKNHKFEPAVSDDQAQRQVSAQWGGNPLEIGVGLAGKMVTTAPPGSGKSGKGHGGPRVVDKDASQFEAYLARQKQEREQDIRDQQTLSYEQDQHDVAAEQKRIDGVNKSAADTLKIQIELRNKIIALDTNKKERETLQENARYSDEKEKYTTEITDKTQLHDTLEVLEKEHTAKLAEITAEADAKVKDPLDTVLSKIESITGALNGKGAEAWKNWGEIGGAALYILAERMSGRNTASTGKSGLSAEDMKLLPPELQTIPKYKKGTNFVPNDGLAFLHKGEAVLPAAPVSETTRTQMSAIPTSDPNEFYANGHWYYKRGDDLLINDNGTWRSATATERYLAGGGQEGGTISAGKKKSFIQSVGDKIEGSRMGHAASSLTAGVAGVGMDERLQNAYDETTGANGSALRNAAEIAGLMHAGVGSMSHLATHGMEAFLDPRTALEALHVVTHGGKLAGFNDSGPLSGGQAILANKDDMLAKSSTLPEVLTTAVQRGVDKSIVAKNTTKSAEADTKSLEAFMKGGGTLAASLSGGGNAAGLLSGASQMLSGVKGASGVADFTGAMSGLTSLPGNIANNFQKGSANKKWGSTLSDIAPLVSMIPGFGTIAGAGMGILGSILSSSGGNTPDAHGPIAGFDTGTPYVPKTGLAYIHEGERISTKSENASGLQLHDSTIAKLARAMASMPAPTIQPSAIRSGYGMGNNQYNTW